MDLEKIDCVSLDATIFYGDVKVKGSSKVSLKLKTCEFTSDFVPLFPLNAEITVKIKYKGTELFKVRGLAYLSTKRFVRLQPITLSLCDNAETILTVPTHSIATCVKKHFFSTTYEQCEIVYCSARKLAISDIVLVPDRQDAKIRLVAGTPLFNEKTNLELTFSNDGMMFGMKNKKARYIYEITNIDMENQQKLLKYIRKSALKEISRQWNVPTSNGFSINTLK